MRAGISRPRQVTVRNLGPVAEPPGRVRLQLTRIVESSREPINRGGALFGHEFGRCTEDERTGSSRIVRESRWPAQCT